MISTERVQAGSGADAASGHVRWDPVQSVWTALMAVVGVGGAMFTVSWENVTIFFVTTAITIGLGHSIGMHRLLIHRSFACPKWLEYLLVWLGVLVGMAGPFGMIRTHDMRDWAQRQSVCHDYYGHRRSFLIDAIWQLHAQLDLRHPPRFRIEKAVLDDPVYLWMERTWRLQQIPVALVLWAWFGVDAVIWGVALRVTVSLTGHWMVGHFAHRDGHQGWRVEGAAVQGYNIPLVALITFGESWHANHHAFPASAKLGLEPGQADPGWWTLKAFERIGLVSGLKTPDALPPRPALRRLTGGGGGCRILTAICRHA